MREGIQVSSRGQFGGAMVFERGSRMIISVGQTDHPGGRTGTDSKHSRLVRRL